MVLNSRPILRLLKTSEHTLSAAELQLVADAGFMHLKNGIIEKVILLFGNLAESYQLASQPLQGDWPRAFGPHPKISKGEKHEELPWVMLDYPRQFDKQTGHLAIRTFFWWGNYFSIQLQVSGLYLPAFLQEIPGWLAQNSDWYAGFAADAWDMALPNTGWQPLGGQLPDDAATEKFVLKLAKKIPIEKWESVEVVLPQYFKSLVQLAASSLSHLGGETAP